MRLDDADVLAFALAEAGRHHGPEEIRKWLSGDRETMPSDLGPVIEGILQNIQYHVNCMNARLLSEPTIADESLRKVASLPPTRLKTKAKSRREEKRGSDLPLPAPITPGQDALGNQDHGPRSGHLDAVNHRAVARRIR